MKSKFNVTTPIIDLLFILLLGFASLFILAFIMMNPISKKNDVKIKEQFMIILTWNDESTSDIDLWVKGPNGTVGFTNKQTSLMYLDHDDIGSKSETILVNGEPQVIKRNREVIYIKTWKPGHYIVNVHAFKLDDEKLKRNIKVEFIKLLPSYKVEFIRKLNFELSKWEEYTMFSFDVPENKNERISITTNEQFKIVGDSPDQ